MNSQIKKFKKTEIQKETTEDIKINDNTNLDNENEEEKKKNASHTIVMRSVFKKEILSSSSSFFSFFLSFFLSFFSSFSHL